MIKKIKRRLDSIYDQATFAAQALLFPVKKPIEP